MNTFVVNSMEGRAGQRETPVLLIFCAAGLDGGECPDCSRRYCGQNSIRALRLQELLHTGSTIRVISMRGVRLEPGKNVRVHTGTGTYFWKIQFFEFTN